MPLIRNVNYDPGAAKNIETSFRKATFYKPDDEEVKKAEIIRKRQAQRESAYGLQGTQERTTRSED